MPCAPWTSRGRRRGCLPRLPGRGAHARSDDARRSARLDPRCRRRDRYRHRGRPVGRASCRARLDATAGLVAGARRPATLVLEWTDPAFTAGHWVPDLVSGAGGECLLGRRGQRSEGLEWSAIASSGAEVVIVAPCGFRLDGAARWPKTSSPPASSRRRRSVGRRRRCRRGAARAAVVDGVELFASILHPDCVGPPTESELPDADLLVGAEVPVRHAGAPALIEPLTASCGRPLVPRRRRVPVARRRRSGHPSAARSSSGCRRSAALPSAATGGGSPPGRSTCPTGTVDRRVAPSSRSSPSTAERPTRPTPAASSA